MLKKIITNIILGSFLIGNSVQAGCFETTHTPPLDDMIQFECSDRFTQENENLEDLYDAFRWVHLTAEFIHDIITIEITDNHDLNRKIINDVSKIEEIIDQKWEQNKYLKKNLITLKNTKYIIIEDYKTFKIKDSKYILDIFYSIFDDYFQPLNDIKKLQLQKEAEQIIIDIIDKEIPL